MTTHRMCFAILLFFVVLLCTPQVYALPWDTPVTQTWYMQPETHTVNTVLGYALNITYPETEASVSATKSGDLQAWYSVRVFKVNSLGNETELTDGTNDVNVTRTTDGEGIQTVTWTPDNTAIVVGSDAVRVNLYIKLGTNNYEQKATFITSTLETKQINNATWTFYLFTNRTYSAPNTVGYFFWGDSAHESRIDNVQLTKLNPWETQRYHLRNRDLISFLVSPWSYYLGDIVWGLALFFCVTTLALKYHSLKPVIPLLWIFGAGGGVLSLLIPSISIGIAWLFLALALALTFLWLIKGRG